MANLRCPICGKNVSLYRMDPFTPGILNSYSYSFNCEHCTYQIKGQDYLKFFGVCYADKEIKYFILRCPLQGREEVLMMEVHRECYSVRFFRADHSEAFLEERHTMNPKEAYSQLIRLSQLVAFI